MAQTRQGGIRKQGDKTKQTNTKQIDISQSMSKISGRPSMLGSAAFRVGVCQLYSSRFCWTSPAYPSAHPKSPRAIVRVPSRIRGPSGTVRQSPAGNVRIGRLRLWLRGHRGNRRRCRRRRAGLVEAQWRQPCDARRRRHMGRRGHPEHGRRGRRRKRRRARNRRQVRRCHEAVGAAR